MNQDNRNSKNRENQRRDRGTNDRNNNYRNKFHNNFNEQNQSNNRYPPKANNKPFNNRNYESNNMNRKLLGNKRNMDHSMNEDYSKNGYQNNRNYHNINNNQDNKNNKVGDNGNRINSFKSLNFSSQKELPIFAFKSEILKKISDNRVIIISGNTGCGKSTQIPQYIFQSNPKNKIIMTQPRRIAAVSISKRLAEEMCEKIGEKIGYHVSMNHKFSFGTKILVVTTGVFLEELIHKNLDYTHIILDEVHERDIYIDLVLAMIKWYFEENPRSRIKIILMSATIAENKFADYLKSINGGEVPIIRIKESIHKMAIAASSSLEYVK